MVGEIVQNAEAHFWGLYQALDAVAREKCYLAFLQAPTWEDCQAFFHQVTARQLTQFVALRAHEVVGWCDILPKPGEACAHVGVLGMGVVAAARGQGVGTALLTAALAHAARKGIVRVELAVRVDNHVAIALYQRVGFVVEGLCRCAYCVDGEFFDVYHMARL